LKVLITGASGLLGSDIKNVLLNDAGIEVSAYSRSEFDVTDLKFVRDAVEGYNVVINCAAYTKVDHAETEKEDAFNVNMTGAKNLATGCTIHKARLIQMSTDYVFDGSKPTHYTEKDIPNPMNIYGASKLAGEKAVRAAGCKYLIIRLQSLFGMHGPNFVDTIVERLSNENTPLQVVSDQISSPTYTKHVAEAVHSLLKVDRSGIINVSASGHCSWFEFAVSIADLIGSTIDIEKVDADSFSRPARRPANSVLDSKWYTRWTGNEMPHWEVGLKEYLAEKGVLV